VESLRAIMVESCAVAADADTGAYVIPFMTNEDDGESATLIAVEVCRAGLVEAIWALAVV
jgi:hypothetical protein